MIKLSDVPKKFNGEYYDIDYFATPKGKKFKRPNGSIEGWSYDNPDGEWLGAGSIVESWKEVFKPKNLLDVGAGRGTFIAYAREVAGIEAVGFDYSEWAIGDGRYGQTGITLHKCKEEWLRLHDATKPWPYDDNSFDLVVALDFFEHIYEDDLPFVISEMYRVASKYIFLQIAVSGTGGLQGRNEKGYILRKGEKIPIELEGCAVAGHVTVKTENWWYEHLYNDDWIYKRDMVYHFCSLIDPRIISNWTANSIIILELIE